MCGFEQDKLAIAYVSEAAEQVLLGLAETTGAAAEDIAGNMLMTAMYNHLMLSGRLGAAEKIMADLNRLTESKGLKVRSVIGEPKLGSS